MTFLCDALQIFNDNMLKINVKRCIRMAIKLRKKYFYKVCSCTFLICCSNDVYVAVFGYFPLSFSLMQKNLLALYFPCPL